MVHKFFCLLLLFFVLLPEAPLAQENQLIISSAADSLTKLLLDQPNNSAAQKMLIKEYVKNSQPELALIELMDFEKRNFLNAGDLMQKAQIFFWEDNNQKAETNFISSYLLEPDNEKLMYIMLCEYASGNKSKAGFLYNQLKNNWDTDMELATLYRRMFSAGKESIAGRIPLFLSEFHQEGYVKYFPKPLINVFSPENNQTADGDEITVTFTVTHGKPVKNVQVNGISLLNEPDGVLTSQNSFSKPFSQSVRLKEGENLISLAADDIYGFNAKSELRITSVNFRTSSLWKSPYSDFYSKNLKALFSYLPEKDLGLETGENVLALVIGNDMPETESYNRAVFISKILERNLPSANLRPIIAKNADYTNTGSLLRNWLSQNINAQSEVIIYYSGELNVDGNDWQFTTADGRNFNLSAELKNICRISAINYTVILDQKKYDVPPPVESIKECLAAVPNNLRIFYLTPRFSYNQFVKFFSDPDFFHEINPADNFDLTNDIGKISEGGYCYYNSRSGQEPIENTAFAAIKKHSEIIKEMNTKLSSDKVPVRNQEKIRTYAASWKNSFDINRYISGVISLDDLIVRIDEYNYRNAGGSNE
ncbi:MAG: hypothetical protein K9I71_11725 [Ignavibacteriales bacterium]|nr:hypothetical protein [Ignavibacteriales bacterium]MCF8316789.1 hypothetical protein [Ignavibacteriales bacterium]MCF8438093.1 hypothetical protein [Ignavibacteriales bacterium]